MANYVTNRIGFLCDRETSKDICQKYFGFNDDPDYEGGCKIYDNFCIVQFDTKWAPWIDKKFSETYKFIPYIHYYRSVESEFVGLVSNTRDNPFGKDFSIEFSFKEGKYDIVWNFEVYSMDNMFRDVFNELEHDLRIPYVPVENNFHPIPFSSDETPW